VTRILNIKTQRDATAALGRLLPLDATAEARASAEALLRAANPHLDLDHIEPGAVLLVPDSPELNRAATEDLSGAALGAVASDVHASLNDLEERSGAALKLGSAARDAVLKDLRSRAVKGIEDAEPDLKAALDVLRRRLAAESRDEKTQRDDFEATLKRAAADFEELQKRFS
jgi:hypothetical protein